jgi:hypothetical protein
VSDDHVREGFEHLQAAAVEIIGAMRAFLEAAEALVKDPSDLLQIVNDLTDTARAAAGQVARQAAPGTAAPPERPPEGGVTRVRVSSKAD